MSIRVDGSTEGAALRSNLGASSLTGMTVTAWIRNRLRTDSAFGAIVFEDDIDASAAGFRYLGWNGSDNMTLARDGATQTFATNPPDDEWIFTGFRYNDTTDVLDGWWHALDGSSETKALPAQESDWTPEQLAFGTNSFDFWADCSFAAMKFWSTDLSDAEIIAERNTILPRRRPNLVGFWPGFPGASERLRDYSGGGNDLTQVGTPTDEQGPPIPWGGRIVVVGQSAGGGVAREMDGTSAGVSGHTADFAVTRGVDGQADAVSGSTADLAVTRTIAGAAAGVSGSSADLAVTRALDGVATATSDVPVTDLAVQRQFAAVMAATSGDAADIEVDRPLDGVAAAVSGSAAELDVAGQVLLDGAAAGVSGSSAQLEVTRAFAGAAAGVSGGAAALDAGRNFTGLAAAVSGGAAQLTLQGQVIFSGTAAAVSGSSGGVAVTRELAGAAVATSGHAVATLARLRELVGSAPAVSGSAAALDAGRRFAGTATAISSSAAELDIAVGLTLFDGIAAAVSGSGASLAATRALSGTATSVSSSAASFVRQANLLGTAAAISGGTGELASVITPFQTINLLGTIETYLLEGSVTDEIDLEGDA